MKQTFFVCALALAAGLPGFAAGYPDVNTASVPMPSAAIMLMVGAGAIVIGSIGRIGRKR